MANSVNRVLHIAPTPFFADRGCHIRVRGIVLALAELGVDSLVCTYPIGRDVRGVRSVRTLRIPGYTKTEAGPSAYKYLADFLLMFTVARQLRKYRPDILHCHLHEGLLVGWIARMLALKWRVPLVFDMQGGLTGELTAHGYFAGRRRLLKLFTFLERSIVSLADMYCCSSEASVTLLTDVFAVEPSNVRLVRDGVDIVEASDDTDVALPVSAGDSTLSTAIYTGGLTRSKGIDVLKEILLEVAGRGLAINFVIVGYPTEELEAFVLKNGLAHCCVLTGQVPYETLNRYLELADYALEPKSSGSGEASGKVVNYMAAGLPVICFNTPNNRDMLGDNGFFAEDDTVVAFVDQLALALSCPAQARKRGAAGIEVASSRFSWRVSVKTIIDAYGRVHDLDAHSGHNRQKKEVK